MSFTLPKASSDLLASLRAQYKIVMYGPEMDSGTQTKPARVVAIVIDNRTGEELSGARAEVVGSGPGAKRQAAIQAIEKSRTAERPQTVAEMAMENRRLKDELEGLRGESAEDSTPNLEEQVTRLAEELKQRGLSSPRGPRRNRPWIAKAERLISQDDEASKDEDLPPETKVPTVSREQELLEQLG